MAKSQKGRTREPLDARFIEQRLKKFEEMGIEPRQGDRVNLQINAYFQHPGDNPVGVMETGSFMLETEEYPYQRPIQVTETWMELEYQWIKQPGLIVIVNRTSFRGPVKLSDEEKAELAEKVIELRVNKLTLPFVILPGMAQPFWMDGDGKLQVRCRKGSCSAFLSVFPR